MSDLYDFEDLEVLEDHEGFEDFEDFELGHGFDAETLSSQQRRRQMIRRMNRKLPWGRNRWYLSKRKARCRAHQAARRLSRRVGRKIRVHHHVYRPLGLPQYRLSDPNGRFLKLRFIYVEIQPSSGRRLQLRGEGRLYESHGGRYQTERQMFLRKLLHDPNQPRFVRGWVKQELNRLARIRLARKAGKRPPGGSKRRIKGVKGYDVGHRVPGVHDHRLFRLEHASTNRARPNYARRLGLKRYRESS